MELKPLHILFISSWYPSRVHRTLGNFVERHAIAVAQMHKVTVLYLTADPTIEETEAEIRDEHGMKVIRVYFRPGTFRPRDHYQAFHFGLKQLKKQKRLDFDLVHGNILYPSAMQALVLQRKFHVPFIYTEHWTGYHRESGPGLGLAAKLMLKHTASKASFLSPVSKHLAKSMEQYGLKGNYAVVPNVVDTELFQPGEKPERFRFIHVSSLVDEHKNISGMLRTIKRVLETVKDVEFHLIGDGDITPHLAYAKKLGIPEENLKIEGEKPLTEIAKAMGQAHAFMLFSHYENLPCVILEAFSCGIPVISSDTGGIREHLDPSRGILITNGQEDELYRGILQIIKGYNDFDPVGIREYAVEQFSESSIAQQFDSLYRKSLN